MNKVDWLIFCINNGIFLVVKQYINDLSFSIYLINVGEEITHTHIVSKKI